MNDGIKASNETLTDIALQYIILENCQATKILNGGRHTVPGFNNALCKKELVRVDHAVLVKKFKTMTTSITARVGI